LCSGYH
jgi:hypothetical protein